MFCLLNWWRIRTYACNAHVLQDMLERYNRLRLEVELANDRQECTSYEKLARRVVQQERQRAAGAAGAMAGAMLRRQAPAPAAAAAAAAASGVGGPPGAAKPKKGELGDVWWGRCVQLRDVCGRVHCWFELCNARMPRR